MGTLLKIWNWFDGKKTAIGAALLLLHGVPHLMGLIGPEALDVILYLGRALAGGGIVHKLTKSV